MRIPKLPKDITDLTDDQVRMFQSLNHERIKSRVADCMLLGFFACLIYMFYVNGWENKLISGGVGALLGNTIVPVVKHYFGYEKRDNKPVANAGKSNKKPPAHLP